jgi:hypothetical protein
MIQITINYLYSQTARLIAEYGDSRSVDSPEFMQSCINAVYLVPSIQ